MSQPSSSIAAGVVHRNEVFLWLAKNGWFALAGKLNGDQSLGSMRHRKNPWLHPKEAEESGNMSLTDAGVQEAVARGGVLSEGPQLLSSRELQRLGFVSGQAILSGTGEAEVLVGLYGYQMTLSSHTILRQSLSTDIPQLFEFIDSNNDNYINRLVSKGCLRQASDQRTGRWLLTDWGRQEALCLINA
ncbi:hypothetical protein WJX82_000120 [Trebouxia sp. C0006]